MFLRLTEETTVETTVPQDILLRNIPLQRVCLLHIITDRSRSRRYINATNNHLVSGPSLGHLCAG